MHDNMSWEGDRMLHIYLWDYFRKRGYSMAAQALSSEAGLAPDQEVPIDAPQGLLFEWWAVFWEVFTARSAGIAQQSQLHPDARAYVQSQELKRDQSSYQQPFHQHPVVAATAPVHLGVSQHGSDVQINLERATHRHASSATSSRNASSNSVSRGPLQPQPHISNIHSDASSSQSLEQAQPSTQDTSHTQRERSSAQVPLSPELSKMLNLPFPVSSTVVDQCLGLMKLGGRHLDTLSSDDLKSLSNRVRRVHTAQNDAQQRMAQLHGLQASKGVAESHTQDQSENHPPTVLGSQLALKRKGSPNVRLQLNREPSVLKRSMSEQQFGSYASWPPDNGSLASHTLFPGGFHSGKASPSHHNFIQPPAPGPMQQQQQQQMMHASSHNNQIRRMQHTQVQMQARFEPNYLPNGVPMSAVSHGQPSLYVDTNSVKSMGPPPSPVSGLHGPMYENADWAQHPAGTHSPLPSQQVQRQSQQSLQHQLDSVGMQTHLHPPSVLSKAMPANLQPGQDQFVGQRTSLGHYASDHEHSLQSQSHVSKHGLHEPDRSGSASVLGFNGVGNGDEHSAFDGLDFDLNAFMSGTPSFDASNSRTLVG